MISNGLPSMHTAGHAGAFQPGQMLAVLHRFGRSTPPPLHRCELCSAPLGEEHAHLLDRTANMLICACAPCAVLFDRHVSQTGARYRRVPRDVLPLNDAGFSDEQWNSLNIPIGLAFFVLSDDGAVAALYPSPAGPTKSLIELHEWNRIAADMPEISAMQPEVEALLVNRIGSTRELWRVPIDQCFKLVGLVRTHWRGISGGDELWTHVAGFFEDLRSRATGVFHA